MNRELIPTPVPDDLCSALHVILECIRRAYYVERMVPNELLDDALEVVRCHLVGIPTTDEEEKRFEPQVRGEGWSL